MPYPVVFPASRADKLCRERRQSRAAQRKKGREKNPAVAAVRYPRGTSGMRERRGRVRAGGRRCSQLTGGGLAAQFLDAYLSLIHGYLLRLPRSFPIRRKTKGRANKNVVKDDTWQNNGFRAGFFSFCTRKLCGFSTFRPRLAVVGEITLYTNARFPRGFQFKKGLSQPRIKIPVFLFCCFRVFYAVTARFLLTKFKRLCFGFSARFHSSLAARSETYITR